MNKFSCTRSLGEEIYYATLIAENDQQAKEMAIEETNRKFSKSGGRVREWSVMALTSPGRLRSAFAAFLPFRRLAGGGCALSSVDARNALKLPHSIRKAEGAETSMQQFTT